MAFMLPTFNLTAAIWHNIFPFVPPTVLPDVITVAALMAPRKNLIEAYEFNELASYSPMWFLLVPKLTDVRDTIQLAGIPDTVEVPAGSGRLYIVNFVDDVAKGYPNEYRMAALQKDPNLLWPTPYP